MKSNLPPLYPLLSVVTVLGLLALASVGCEPPQRSRTSATESSAHFDTNIDNDKLILVKFGAKWCPPCRDVDRELEGLEGQLPADVEVLKIDVDENPELVERYDVFSIPRMMLVRDGDILDEEVGYLSGNQILGWIDGYRGGDSAN